MVYIGDGGCRQVGGRKDGERTALACYHKLSVTTVTVLAGRHTLSWTGSHYWGWGCLVGLVCEVYS